MQYDEFCGISPAGKVKWTFLLAVRLVHISGGAALVHEDLDGLAVASLVIQ